MYWGKIILIRKNPLLKIHCKLIMNIVLTFNERLKLLKCETILMSLYVKDESTDL